MPRPSLDELEAWLRAQPLHDAYTGESLTIDTLTVEHMVPLDREGSNELSNLCIISDPINRAKGNLTACEFHQLLALTATWEDGGRGLMTRLRAAGTIFGRR